jgi:hypothetical protein
MSTGFTIAEIASTVAIASGVNSLTGGALTGQKSPSSGQAQQMADPFSGYRDNLAQMYSGALQPGKSTSIENMPGFTQFNTGVMQPALDASKRSAAASGMLQSGNEQIALQKTAQQGYYGFMTDYMNRLAQGSGAVNNPANAAGMGLQQGQYNQANAAAGLGAIGQGLSGLQGQFSGSPAIGSAGYANDQYGLSGTGGYQIDTYQTPGQSLG